MLNVCINDVWCTNIDYWLSRREHIQAEIEKERMSMGGDDEVVEDFGDGYFAPYQKALWDLFEKPQSSFCAKLISLLSIGKFNTINMLLETTTCICI